MGKEKRVKEIQEKRLKLSGPPVPEEAREKVPFTEDVRIIIIYIYMYIDTLFSSLMIFKYSLVD